VCRFLAPAVRTAGQFASLKSDQRIKLPPDANSTRIYKDNGAFRAVPTLFAHRRRRFGHDVHSQLNGTRVRELLIPRTGDELVEIVAFRIAKNFADIGVWLPTFDGWSAICPGQHASTPFVKSRDFLRSRRG